MCQHNLIIIIVVFYLGTKTTTEVTYNVTRNNGDNVTPKTAIEATYNVTRASAIMWHLQLCKPQLSLL